MNILRNKKGFTLVECIVAIAVIVAITATAVLCYQVSLRSTGSQLDKFQCTVEANNALAIFQVSEDFTAFDKYFTGLGSNNIVSSQAYEISGAKYSQADLDEQIVPTSFTKVRAYESGKVSFMSGDEYIVDFEYGSNSQQYKNDTAMLSNTSGIYKVAYVDKSQGGLQSLTYTLSGTDGSNNSNTFTILYDYIDGSNKKSTSLYVHISDGTTKVTEKATDFEVYLFNNRYVLRPFKYGWSGSTGNKMTCYLYQISADGKSCNPVLDSNKKWTYYALNGSVKNYSSAKWSAGTAYTISVQKSSTASNSKYSGRSGMSSDLGDGQTYSSFSWKYFPILAFKVAYNSSNPSSISGSDTDKPATISKTAITKAAGGTNYTDYILKDSSVVSSIGYVVSDGTNGAKVYNPQSTLLYTYTGSRAADILPSFGTCKFNAKESVKDTNDYKYYKRLNLDQLKYVEFIDSEKKIVFKNVSGVNIIAFYYETAEKYTEAKESITVSNYDYAPYFKQNANGYMVDYSVKSKDGIPFTRWSTCLRQTGDGYELVDNLVAGEEESETTIFASDAYKVYSYSDNVEIQPEFAEVSLGGIVATTLTMTKYYKYICGNYGLLIRVTHSNISYDNSTEPKIKIWIMDAKDVEAVKSEDITAIASDDTATVYSNIKKFEDKFGDPYISYRKG